jgi:hypothetical protein
MSPMYLTAKRQLDLQPDVLVRCPSGQLVTLSRKPLEAAFLDAYTPGLERVWGQAVDRDSLGIFWHGGRVWVLDRTGASVYTDGGELTRRANFAIPAGMRVGGAVPIEDGLVVAVEHDDCSPVVAPVLMRVSEHGDTVWSSTLPMTDVALEMERMEEGAPPTRVREPVATWQCSYQGYGIFETHRHAPDGRVRHRWPTSGHFVVRGSDIRVVELQNDSRAMHVVRLEHEARVTRGDRLPGYHTSQPSIASDGLLRFFRGGVV